jgi:hypothetical protein
LTSFAVSQALIGISFIFDLLSFQFKDRKKILICFIISAFFVAAHFIVLSKITAGLIIFISIARFVTASFTASKKWMVFFMLLTVTAFAGTYSSPVSAVALCGSLIGSWASFQKTDRLVRIGMMCGTLLWIIHNALVGSPAAVALECFFLGSNLVGFYRYYVRKVIRDV